MVTSFLGRLFENLYSIPARVLTWAVEPLPRKPHASKVRNIWSSLLGFHWVAVKLVIAFAVSMGAFLIGFAVSMGAVLAGGFVMMLPIFVLLPLAMVVLSADSVSLPLRLAALAIAVGVPLFALVHLQDRSEAWPTRLWRSCVLGLRMMAVGVGGISFIVLMATDVISLPFKAALVWALFLFLWIVFARPFSQNPEDHEAEPQGAGDVGRA